MLKLIVLVTRRPDLDREQFARYWLDVHAPLAEAQGLRGYVIDVATADQPAGALDGVDGVAEIWFDSREHLEAALSSPAGVRAAEDVTNFASSVRVVTVEPHTVVPPPHP